MGKVSIIIPVYNTKKYITACIESLQNQTYKNIEIIIVNDNSDKECTELLEKISNQYSEIRLFHFQERKGVGAARNFAIERSRGEFIYFLDSDDYLPSRTLELLIENIGDEDVIRGRMKTTNFSNSFAIIFDGMFKTEPFTDKKYNLIKNSSAVNFLFKKEFIKREKLAFSESVEIYSDLSFMLPVLIHVEKVLYLREAIYFKRRRNDPILNPSLSQYNVDIKIRNFIYMYNKLKNKYSDEMANDFLDKQFLNFYRKDIVTYFKKNGNIEEFFEQLSNATKKVNVETLSRYDMVLKNEVMALRNGNLSQFMRKNARHNFLRDIKEGLKTKRKFLTFLYRSFFMKLPMKKELVVFESFLGRSYSDNPKYIYEYMTNNKMDFKYVWSVTQKMDIPNNHIQVKRFSLRYFYYLARAKYWISNSRMPGYLDKREENIYLQTWHGTPLKLLAGDMEDVYMPGTNSATYKRNFFNETQKWDYLISPNAYSSEIFKRAFWFDKTMIESGYPRNDILYNKNNENTILSLKRRMNLPLDKKVILYAPTWRDDEYYSKGKYKFKLQLDLEKLQDQLGDEYIIILRMHYFIASQLDISAYEGFVYDLSNHNDIAELYVLSDLLITDYSSVFFDYAHLKRPVLFFTYDLERYRDKLRGFYIDIEREVPGPLLMNTDEVIHAVENINDVIHNYDERYQKFYNKFCKWDDGHAADKVVKKVFDL